MLVTDSITSKDSTNNTVLLIGISGGSGSGKTTFAKRLKEALNETCQIITQDSYYIDQSDKFDHDGGSVNFDHPSALDFDLLAKQLKQLKSGNSVEIPQYNFSTHKREEITIPLQPTKIILVDGILLFSQPQIFEILDHKIFVDCPEELRFTRRLERDVKERGRTPEGVKAQFMAQVKPMHDEFVEPTKHQACSIVNVENFDQEFKNWVQKLI